MKKRKANFGTNVTEVLNWVAKGSAACGVVYATDAASSKDVKVLDRSTSRCIKNASDLSSCSIKRKAKIKMQLMNSKIRKNSYRVKKH